MGKIIYPLKPCPWCRKTPVLYMFMGTDNKLEKTYLPVVKCNNLNCTVQPKTKSVPIRKNQRFDAKIIKIKIERLVAYWNENNPLVATEGFEIDFEASIKENEEE
jgi:hypothetical protein